MLDITIGKKYKYRKEKHEPSILQTTGEDEPNKKVDIKFSMQNAFWNNQHQVRSKSKNGKSNNLKLWEQ
jgi:hypothetical protein